MSTHRKQPAQALFDEYIAQCVSVRRLRSETIRGYKRVWSFFSESTHVVNVSDITSAKITEFFRYLETRERLVGKKMMKTGIKDSTVATYSSKLHSFFKWLVERGEMSANPLHGIPRRTPTYEDVRALTDAEVQKIRAAIERRAGNLLQVKRDRAMVAVLLGTGIRRGELIGLTTMDVDLEKRVLRVRGETSKSGKTRFIPFGYEVAGYLRDFLEERYRRSVAKRRKFYTTPKLFVSLIGDFGLTVNGTKHWTEDIHRLSGVKFHLHRFRHTFACNFILNGGNIVSLQKLLGHSDLRMTQVYVRSLGVEDARGITDIMPLAGIAQPVEYGGRNL